jgi:hypothetical protein
MFNTSNEMSHKKLPPLQEQPQNDENSSYTPVSQVYNFSKTQHQAEIHEPEPYPSRRRSTIAEKSESNHPKYEDTAYYRER